MTGVAANPVEQRAVSTSVSGWALVPSHGRVSPVLFDWGEVQARGQGKPTLYSSVNNVRG